MQSKLRSVLGWVLFCALLMTSSTSVSQTNPWVSHGPEGGWVNALAVHPTTVSTVYAGAFGGVFKTTDAGANWGPINNGLSTNNVYTILIDVHAPDTLYAGTKGGIFKTTDAGATWNASNVGLPNTDVKSLAMD